MDVPQAFSGGDGAATNIFYEGFGVAEIRLGGRAPGVAWSGSYRQESGKVGAGGLSHQGS